MLWRQWTWLGHAARLHTAFPLQQLLEDRSVFMRVTLKAMGFRTHCAGGRMRQIEHDVAWFVQHERRENWQHSARSLGTQAWNDFFAAFRLWRQQRRRERAAFKW